MGIEIVIGLFTVASMTFGLIVPVLGWAVWTDRGQRRLLQGIEDDDSYGVDQFEAGDAATPVRMRLHRDGRRIELSALMRGTTPLWRVEISHCRPAPALVFVEERWVPACRPCRELQAVGAPTALARRGFELYASDEPAARSRLDESMLLDAVVAVLAHAPGAKELHVEADRVALEVERQGLRAADALVWLSLLLRLADVVDGAPAAPLPLLPGRTVIGHDGSAVAVPGAPATS